jgi:hypothetical protein
MHPITYGKAKDKELIPRMHANRERLDNHKLNSLIHYIISGKNFRGK